MNCVSVVESDRVIDERAVGLRKRDVKGESVRMKWRERSMGRFLTKG